MAKRTLKYCDYLIHPGVTLAEALQEKQLKQNELAIRTGLSEKHISQIINGKEAISYETAVKLEQVLGLPASFWNALEAEYCEEKIKMEQLANIKEEELNILDQISYKSLVEWGYIENRKTKEERVIQARKFLNVTDLLQINKLATRGMLFRKSKAINMNIYAMYVWLKICELETQTINNRFERKKLKSALPKIKDLNVNYDISDSIKKLSDIFSDCGVAFKVVHNIKGAPVQGMIKKIDDKVALFLTIRNKFADIFWFTLFHEIGHLLFDNLESDFVDFDFSNRTESEIELKADDFASNYLINKEKYLGFIEKQNFSTEEIVKFSNEQNILPCILVGRLQHDNIIPMSWHNDLKVKYEWSR